MSDQLPPQQDTIDGGPQEPEGDPPAEKHQPEAHRRSRRPQNPKGWYMVLASYVIEGALFGEVGWYKANDDDHAKRLAADDAKNGHLPDLKEVLEGSGALLRAVPARSWPKTEPSGYKAPAPKLRIG